jgi:UDP-N-acetylglucosamine--N-acetylmuramyl-(pentapeptide) pyrophosphoryl-undecaprenol N-acetylglucosamine transferase
MSNFAKRNKSMGKNLRIIISGGGTGGHIFPAISIANAIKMKRPEAEILFVGAEGRMEMQRVPDAGYEIKGLPICGFDRKHLWKNVSVLFKILKSQRMAKKIIQEFQPMAAVGVGGYASGPTLNKCADMGIPCLIQEQNSYAGVTNKLLAKKAEKICVAYEGMERFFPAEKIIITGNPVRQALLDTKISREEAILKMGLDPSRKTILIVGGSLGAKTINDSVLKHLDIVKSSGMQFIWQTGKYYYQQIVAELSKEDDLPMLKMTDFISDMGVAYKAADLVISRAGASSISEFCLIGKPVILVPSPNVAEDHQTKNAMALVNKDAAIHVKDADAPDKLLEMAVKTVQDEEKLASLSANIFKMALPNSAEIIADAVIEMAERQVKK